LIGGLIGGGTGRIIGAGIGGIAGAAVGYTMDKQIKELKEKTAGSGVDVKSVDDGQAILVNLPSGVTFDTDSTVIKPGFRDTLDKVADSLNRYPNSLIDVYGHTDRPVRTLITRPCPKTARAWLPTISRRRGVLGTHPQHRFRQDPAGRLE
jgi:hypothetical protein